MISYFELNELLTNAEAEICAAECHGFLCGQICTSHYPDEELWLEFVDAQTDDTAVAVACHREISNLLDEIAGDLQSDEFDFQLMLPDDDSALNERVQALAEWCHGFLNGYGVGMEDAAAAMSDECREILDDFTRICQVDEVEAADEEDEQALMELIEHVRTGTMIIYSGLLLKSGMGDDPEVLH
jgi:yecA family protein